jgi:hypothetical protein
MDEQAFASGIASASREDIENALRAALNLEQKMYAREDTAEALFRLRKALEGIWGHDLP